MAPDQTRPRNTAGDDNLEARAEARERSSANRSGSESRAGGENRARGQRSSPSEDPGEAMRDAAREQLNQGKRAAGHQADAAAEALGAAASRLRGENETLAGYAEQLSHGIASVADGLRMRSVDELSAEVQDLARRNPLLFILGSIAAGVAVSRFMKAGSRTTQRTH